MLFRTYDTGTYGYSFTVGDNPLLVTALASAYAGASGEVRIWQAGTTTNLAQVYIPGNAPDITSSYGNVYGYESITPTLLQAHTTYNISWDNAIYGQAFSYFSTGVSNDSDVTIGDGISSYGVGDFATTDQVGIGPYFGPSFESIRAVPEPSSLALIGIGGLFGMGVVRRRLIKKSA